MKKVDNQLLVIFGASGDLTVRKLIPALFNLYKEGHLCENFAVLGTSRSNLSDDEFRAKVVSESEYLKDSISEEAKDFIQDFADRMFYEDLGGSYEEPYLNLKKRIEKLNDEFSLDHNVIYYLSTPPGIYELISKNLKEQDLNNEDKGWKRLIVEKPFGYTLETAKALNKGLQKYFKESVFLNLFGIEII